MLNNIIINYLQTLIILKSFLNILGKERKYFQVLKDIMDLTKFAMYYFET